MKKIKVGYISPVNPEEDRMAWSGTFYNTFHAIRDAGADVEWVPYNTNSIVYKGLSKFVSLICKIRFGHGSSIRNRMMSKLHAKFIDQNCLSDYDLLFIPAQIEIVAGLNTETPIIYYTDGTFKKMVGYYWFGYSKKAIEEGNKIEEIAVKKAKYNFRSSKWAADSTISDYHADPNNTYIFPFGADVPSERTNASLPDYENNTLKLLFSGKEWERKGGDIAVEATEYLNRAGIKTDLYIVGQKTKVSSVENKEYIHWVGYLDKNSNDGFKKYLNLYQNCNCFILPTRAECSALVFAEANAFGMPIFSTETGGIGDYVINGINGYRLEFTASGEDFGKKIEECYIHKQFNKLSEGANEIYSQSTSWKAWSKHFMEFVEKEFGE